MGVLSASPLPVTLLLWGTSPREKKEGETLVLSLCPSRTSVGRGLTQRRQSRAACCIAGTLRLNQPAPLAAPVLGAVIPGSARMDRSKHPDATLDATLRTREPAAVFTTATAPGPHSGVLSSQ